MYKPEVTSRAVWNRSLSCFFHAAADFLSASGSSRSEIPGSGPGFVDCCEVCGNVVVEAVEHDEYHRNAREHTDKSLVRVGVWLKPAILKCADRVLHSLVTTIQRC